MVSEIPHRFIVVEGPIGVGKTSLARRLGQRWAFRDFFGEHSYRLMCSWATQIAAVEELVAALD